jgi:hypothetical protein
MWKYIFKAGTYFLFWNQYKQQLITLLYSTILVVLIFSIYNDIFSVLKISETSNILLLIMIKYILIILIVVYCFYKIKRLNNTKKDISNDTKSTKVDPIHDAIISKKVLRSKTDNILAKYKK